MAHCELVVLVLRQLARGGGHVGQLALKVDARVRQMKRDGHLFDSEAKAWGDAMDEVGRDPKDVPEAVPVDKRTGPGLLMY